MKANCTPDNEEWLRSTRALWSAVTHCGWKVASSAAASITYWLRRYGLGTAGLVIVLLLIYGPALVAHIRRSTNPYVFNDDVRALIFPFFKYHEPGLFPNDYFGPYIRTCFVPEGYRFLYTVGALVCDPSDISKALPYILLFVTVAALAAAAHRLAGYSGALSAAALALSCNWIFLGRMAGGLQRAFAFPTLALVAFALVCGRPRLLAIVIGIGVAFYPPGAIVGGIALAIWLLLLPKQHRGRAARWSLLRRLRLLVFTAGVCVLILLPTVFAGHAYGRVLRPKDVIQYPELGPGGRYGPDDRPPFATFPKAALQQAQTFFRPVGKPYCSQLQAWAKLRDRSTGNTNADVIIEVLAGAMLIGAMLLAARQIEGRRLLLIGAAAWLAHLLARALLPYLYIPQRYVAYPIPILLILLVPAAGAALGQLISAGRFATFSRQLGAIALTFMILLPFGGRGSTDAGLNIDVTAERKLYDFLGRLPKDALIAGWPTQMDSVPYVSRRQALLTAELHLPLHKGYTDEMRRRMRALIDAYFATDLRALQRLRDQFGVTHLIFNAKLLRSPPTYFEPFSGWIRTAFNDGQLKGFEIPRQLAAATVFSDGELFVLDLHRLSETH